MTITFLGTNGWYDNENGMTPSILIDSENYYIVLDAGNSLYKLKKLIREKKPIYLFLSHLHLDHIYGLHVLPIFDFPQGISIYLQTGTKKLLENIITLPYTNNIYKNKYPISLNEIGEGGHQKPINFTALLLQHPVSCLGFRFNIDGKIITYCTDTRPCENSEKLAENADILIHEAGYNQPRLNVKMTNWGHSTPETTALEAKQTNAKKCYLMHFSPPEYPSLKDRHSAELRGQKIYPNVFSAYDDMRIKI